MTWFSKLLMIATILIAGYWLSQSVLLHSGLEKVGIEIPSEVELDISRGYVIPMQRQLNYTLSQSPEKIWISSSAVLGGTDNKTANYPYSLTILVYDKNDEILYRNEFHHQSSASKLVELSVNSQLVPEAFLADTEQKLSAPQNVHFQLPPGATRMEISQQVRSPQISDVVLRAYQFVQRSSRVEAIDLWQRLSQKQRRKLTENFPFEAPFLTNQEKSNLAEFRWQPLVPQGDENEDYKSLLMYRVNNQFIATKKHLLSQYDHHADAYKRVSFPIEVAGRYRLEGQHEFTARDLTVNMQWFNLNDSWMKAEKFAFSDTKFSQEIDLKPGLVTFTTSIPTSINLFAINGLVEEHDHFSSGIVLLPGQELIYRVEHPVSGAETLDTKQDATQIPVTPMQIQARAFAEQDLSTGPDARLTIVSKSNLSGGESVSTDHLNVEYLPDENSQLANEEFFNWLGVSQKLYLQLRQPTDTLSITSNQPVLVTVYTRLGQMPAIRVLPEEKRDWFDYPSGVPDWFSVRPENWEDLVNMGAIRLVKHYHRSLLQDQIPPDPDETYQSLLEDFQTLQLLDIMVENPFVGQTSKVEENVALNFAPVNFDEMEFNVEEVNANGATANASMSIEGPSRPLQRRWLFVKDTEEPQEISWTKNGALQSNFWVAGKWGILDENSLFIGPDDLVKFSSLTNPSSQISWWQNGIPREQAIWQQRRAALLSETNKISLRNHKTQEEEMLSVVVYSTTTEPVKLKATFTGYQRNPHVTDSFTITDRQYQIQPREAYSGFQLAGSRRIAGRQSFSIFLGKDILPGDMQIEIEHLQGDDVFISVVKRVFKPKPIIQRFRTVTEH